MAKLGKIRVWLSWVHFVPHNKIYAIYIPLPYMRLKQTYTRTPDWLVNIEARLRTVLPDFRNPVTAGNFHFFGKHPDTLHSPYGPPFNRYLCSFYVERIDQKCFQTSAAKCLRIAFLWVISQKLPILAA